MKATALIFAALAALTAASSAQALEPAGKWHLDSSEAGCVLERQFGSSERSLSFGFRHLPLLGVVELFVISSPDVHFVQASGEGMVRFEPGTWNGKYKATRLANGSWLGMAMLPVEQLDDLARAAQVDITLEPAIKAQLTNTGMVAALTAERTCEQNVLAAWRIDAAAIARISHPPEPISPATWVTNDDYPTAAMLKGVSGQVAMVWRIDTSGRASDCKIVQSSGNITLDESSCRIIIARARYKPARDSEGQPIDSWAARYINWTLPPN